MLPRIVSGYLLSPNDLRTFVHKIYEGSITSEEGDDLTSHFQLLICWVRALAKAERVAPINYLLPDSGMVVCILTAAAQHHNAFARINESDRQRLKRDAFIAKANADAGAEVFAAERMRYFSLEEDYVGLPLGLCYYNANETSDGESDTEEGEPRAPAIEPASDSESAASGSTA